MLLSHQTVIKPALIAGLAPCPAGAEGKRHAHRIKRVEDILNLATQNRLRML